MKGIMTSNPNIRSKLCDHKIYISFPSIKKLPTTWIIDQFYKIVLFNYALAGRIGDPNLADFHSKIRVAIFGLFD
jgi:hypothetical protein